MVRVAIVGTGDFAHGLAHVFKNNNTQSSGNILTVTKPGFGFGFGLTPQPAKGGQAGGQEAEQVQYFHLTGVQVGDFYNTVQQADIVVLGIPAYALPGFVKNYSTLLQGKILVDPTNAWKQKATCSDRDQDMDLNALLASQGAVASIAAFQFRWVKAFNDVCAVDLLSRHAPMNKPIASKMCSPDDEALEMVKNFAESSLGFCIKKVPIEHYWVIATHQNQVAGGNEWLSATLTMVAVFMVTQMYSILRYVANACSLVRLLFELAMELRYHHRYSSNTHSFCILELDSNMYIMYMNLTATTLPRACRTDHSLPFS
jgi:predicted dinucleotide-binding enzyme